MTPSQDCRRSFNRHPRVTVASIIENGFCKVVQWPGWAEHQHGSGQPVVGTFAFPLLPSLPFPAPRGETEGQTNTRANRLTLIPTAAARVSPLQPVVVYSALPARRNLRPRPTTVSSATTTPPPPHPPSPPSSVLLPRIQTQIPHSNRKQAAAVCSGALAWPLPQNLVACLAPPQQAQQQAPLHQEEVSLALPRRRHNLNNRPEASSASLPLRRSHSRRAACSAARPPPTRRSHSKPPEVSLARRQRCKSLLLPLSSEARPPTHNQRWAPRGQVCSARSPPKQAAALAAAAACCKSTLFFYFYVDVCY